MVGHASAAFGQQAAELLVEYGAGHNLIDVQELGDLGQRVILRGGVEDDVDDLVAAIDSGEDRLEDHALRVGHWETLNGQPALRIATCTNRCMAVPVVSAAEVLDPMIGVMPDTENLEGAVLDIRAVAFAVHPRFDYGGGAGLTGGDVLCHGTT